MDQNTIKNLADLISFNVLVAGALIFFAAWVVVRVFEYLFAAISRRFPRHRLQITRVFPLVRLIVWSVAFYVFIVDVINPPENTALAILASAGLAMGLAAQDTVKNILSGILILFDQPFRVGDMIRIGDHYGEVLRIDSRTTRIRTFDDNIISFPNSFVWTQAISNANNGNLDEMVVVSFQVPAYLDVQMLKDLAWEAAAASPFVYLKKNIIVLVEDRYDRAFLTRVTIKCYVIDIRYERLLASDVCENVKNELVKQGVITEELFLYTAAAENHGALIGA
ncbi:MAG: mechanosensitive ion channel family protein [Gammaproteobacteria bacterium]|nr:mechanosensitive ion channel family protein [Gammaproteobacteria bacterium]MDH5694331.1 mechanosensitive ion channel family protein [Gammaproteobacteria bacterium]